MSGVQIPIQAQFDSGDLDKALATLTEHINSLGGKIGEVNRLKFNPIDRTTLADIDRVKAQFESLNKISADFRRRMKNTGQEKSDFFDIDWSRMYVDPNARARQMRKAYEYVTAGTGAYFQDLPKEPGPTGKFGTDDIASKREWERINGGRNGGGGSAPTGPAAPPEDPASPAAVWSRRVVSTGLRSSGPVGGVADDALSAGLSGGAMAGVGGLLGGLVALGVGKAIGAVRQQVGVAEQEGIGYDTLKRQLGDVGVGFEVLRQSLRSAADGLGITYQEGTQLGKEFAKLAGMSAANYKTLGDEVQLAGGFARSFGLTTGQSNAFFGQMRNLQVTHNTDDSRSLQLMIADAIAKSGAFAKADEMLQAISGFATQQTRLGLSTANVGDYTGMLAGLVGSKTPGLDPAGAASMLSRVNSSITNGGNAGEAGQNFMYMTLGKRLNLDPIQTKLLMQQGAFGTAAGTFDKNGLVGKWMKDNGVAVSGDAQGSHRTNLEMVLEGIKRQYNGSPERRELGLNAGANLLGINETAFAALSTIKPQKLGSLMQLMKAAKVDLSQLDSSNVSKLAQIGDDKGLSEEEKIRRIREEAPKSQEQTEGDETRKSIARVENALTKAAGTMVPIFNDMRSAMIYMATGGGKIGPKEMQAAVIRGQHDENRRMINASSDKLKAAQKQDEKERAWSADRIELGRKLQNPKLTPAERAKIQAQLDSEYAARNEPSDVNKAIESDRAQRLKAEQDSEEGELKALYGGNVPDIARGVPAPGASPGAGGGGKVDKAGFYKRYDAFAERVAKNTGNSKRLILAQIALETGWGASELAGSNNPMNVQAGAGWSGATIDAIDHHRDGSPYVAHFRAYGSRDDAADDYSANLKRKWPGAMNAGDDAGKFVTGLHPGEQGGYAESSSYRTNFTAIANGMQAPAPDTTGKPMPAAAAKAEKDKAKDAKADGAQPQKISLEVLHTHERPDGSPMPGVQSVNKLVYAPSAYGVNYA